MARRIDPAFAYLPPRLRADVERGIAELDGPVSAGPLGELARILNTALLTRQDRVDQLSARVDVLQAALLPVRQWLADDLDGRSGDAVQRAERMRRLLKDLNDVFPREAGGRSRLLGRGL